MIDLTISAGAILAVLLSVFLAHKLTKSREEQRQYTEAVTLFKESFVPFLKSLEDIDTSPAQVITENFPHQDELARKLLIKIPRKTKIDFEAKWALYHNLYKEKLHLGMAALIATEVDDLQLASSSNSNAAEYIYSQTKARLEHTHKLVSEALNVL